MTCRVMNLYVIDCFGKPWPGAPKQSEPQRCEYRATLIDGATLRCYRQVKHHGPCLFDRAKP